MAIYYNATVEEEKKVNNSTDTTLPIVSKRKQNFGYNLYFYYLF